MKKQALLTLIVPLVLLLTGCDKIKEWTGQSEPAPSPQPAVKRLPLKPPEVEQSPTPVPTPTPEEVIDRSRRRSSGSSSGEWSGGQAASGRRARPSKNVALAQSGRIGNKAVAAGEYEVRLRKDRKGPVIELVQNGAVVASELAVMPRKQPTWDANGSWVWLDDREEKMLRIFTQQGRELYFITFGVD